MAHPYHHALSSVKKYGGKVEDYLPIHNWFDETKKLMGDIRHRALRHHAEGIFLCEQIFGVTITNSAGKQVPTRFIGEQHVQEDLGHIPAAVDWLREMAPKAWMGKVPKMELDQQPELSLPMELSLVVSTAHISKKDDELLTASSDLRSPLLIDKQPYGFIVHVPPESELEQTFKDCAAEGYSSAFVDLIEMAFARGATMLRLNADGPTAKGLPVFTW